MSKCSKHGCDLERGSMQVRYGMPPAPPDGYFEAQAELFPKARTWEMGGCVVDLDSGNEVKVNYCPECREAEKTWEAAHPMDGYWRS